MISHLDHLVLTVADLDATVAFYRVLGLRHERFGAGRHALVGDGWKINLHPASAPIEPHARTPMPGSADLCFLLSTTLEDAYARLDAAGIPLELGPVDRTGSTGPIRSLYLRDPDGNLIELSVPA